MTQDPPVSVKARRVRTGMALFLWYSDSWEYCPAHFEWQEK